MEAKSGVAGGAAGVAGTARACPRRAWCRVSGVLAWARRAARRGWVVCVRARAPGRRRAAAGAAARAGRPARAAAARRGRGAAAAAAAARPPRRPPRPAARPRAWLRRGRAAAASASAIRNSRPYGTRLAPARRPHARGSHAHAPGGAAFCGYGWLERRLGRGGGTRSPVWFFCTFRKYFCAWLRICTAVLLPTCSAQPSRQRAQRTAAASRPARKRCPL